jgi:hypothetical protein
MVFVYACGFNAYHQITPPSDEAPPLEDLHSLTQIMQNPVKAAWVLFAGWSTIVCTYDLPNLAQIRLAQAFGWRCEWRLVGKADKQNI